MAGNVKQSFNSLGVQGDTYVMGFEWTGDSSDGSVPTTVSKTQGFDIQGFAVTNCEIISGSPVPSSGYSVQILNSSNIDLLGATGLGITASSLSIATTSGVPPVNGALRLVVTGNSVAGAKGKVLVYLRRVALMQLFSTPTGATSGSTSDLTADYLRLTNNPYTDNRKTNWSYLSGTTSVSGSLATPGPQTLTITTPLGCYGANVGHYIRISGGVEAAEVCLITGGTCVAGVTTGTLTFTTVNAHTGAWSIGSATSGIQEAFYAGAPSDIFIADGAWSIFAPITIYGQGGNTTRITGAGSIASRLIRQFAAGDLIYYNGLLGPGDLIMSDFGIVNGSGSMIGTSGSAIHLKDYYTTNITRVAVTDGFKQFHTEGTGALCNVDACEFRYTAAYTQACYPANQPTEAILINSATVNFTRNEIVQSIRTSGGAPVYAEAFPSIKVKRGDGHVFEDNRIGGLDGIQFDHNGLNPFNFVYVRNNVINGFYRFGIYFTATSAGGQEFQTFEITDNDLVAQFLYPPYTTAGPAQHSSIYSDNSALKVVLIQGNLVRGVGQDGIRVNNGQYFNITGNTISDCNASNTTGSGVYLSGNGQGNCVTANFSGFVRDTLQTAGLYITGSQANLNASGNNFSYNAVLGVALVSSPNISGEITDNAGQSNSYETVASASTITSTRLGTIDLTGVTTVTNIVPAWAGRRQTITKTDAGACTIGAGVTILGTPVVLNQYGSVTLEYNGLLTAWVFV